MSKQITFHYDPTRKGLGQILGDLELEVMKVLWKHGRSSVRDMLEHFHRDVAYASVITVANRLFKKGMLSREMEGKTYYYTPRLNRQELLDLASRRVLDRVADIAPPATVVHLIDSVVGEDPEVLAELERLIEQRKRQLQKKKTT